MYEFYLIFKVSKPVSCEICGTVIYRQDYLRIHMLTHSSSRQKYKCPFKRGRKICGKPIGEVKNLVSHCISQHGLSREKAKKMVGNGENLEKVQCDKGKQIENECIVNEDSSMKNSDQVESESVAPSSAPVILSNVLVREGSTQSTEKLQTQQVSSSIVSEVTILDNSEKSKPNSIFAENLLSKNHQQTEQLADKDMISADQDVASKNAVFPQSQNSVVELNLNWSQLKLSALLKSSKNASKSGKSKKIVDAKKKSNQKKSINTSKIVSPSSSNTSTIAPKTLLLRPSTLSCNNVRETVIVQNPFARAPQQQQPGAMSDFLKTDPIGVDLNIARIAMALSESNRKELVDSQLAIDETNDTTVMETTPISLSNGDLQDKINWWLNCVPNNTKLMTMETTANGNCLCHAIHQVLKLTEDSEMKLRMALQNFFKAHDNDLHEIWYKDSLEEQACLGYTLTEQEMVNEWNEIIECTSPDPIAGLNDFHYLEGIHIFALANLLKSPIIVLGNAFIRGDSTVNAIQSNTMIGIYLPFMFEPWEHISLQQPLFIAYDSSHFCALIPEIQSSNYKVPIVDSSGQLLKIHFVDDEDVTDNMRLDVLKKYLTVNQEDNGVLCVSWPSVVLDVMGIQLPIYIDSLGKNAAAESREQIQLNENEGEALTTCKQTLLFRKDIDIILMNRILIIQTIDVLGQKDKKDSARYRPCTRSQTKHSQNFVDDKDNRAE